MPQMHGGKAWVLRFRSEVSPQTHSYVRVLQGPGGSGSTHDLNEAAFFSTAKEAAECLYELGHPEAWSIEPVFVNVSPVVEG